jgi:hypothetical protein
LLWVQLSWPHQVPQMTGGPKSLCKAQRSVPESAFSLMEVAASYLGPQQQPLLLPSPAKAVDLSAVEAREASPKSYRVGKHFFYRDKHTRRHDLAKPASTHIFGDRCASSRIDFDRSGKIASQLKPRVRKRPYALRYAMAHHEPSA